MLRLMLRRMVLSNWRTMPWLVRGTIFLSSWTLKLDKWKEDLLLRHNGTLPFGNSMKDKKALVHCRPLQRWLSRHEVMQYHTVPAWIASTMGYGSKVSDHS